MTSKDDMKLFISEAEDLIQKTEDEILLIEENPKALKPIQELFFTFHTLKGLTAMAGFENLSKFCHHFETFLENAKDKKVSVSKRTTGMSGCCSFAILPNSNGSMSTSLGMVMIRS